MIHSFPNQGFRPNISRPTPGEIFEPWSSRNPRSPGSWGRFLSLGGLFESSLGGLFESLTASASHGAPAGGRRPSAIGWDKQNYNLRNFYPMQFKGSTSHQSWINVVFVFSTKTSFSWILGLALLPVLKPWPCPSPAPSTGRLQHNAKTSSLPMSGTPMQCQEDQCKANLCKSGQLSRAFALSPLEIQMGGAIIWVFSSIFRTQSLPKNHS